ncbi:pilus assembly protein FlpE [Cellulomonas edaphi]|uniref:Pilus assembly protein FlpE n=1 Tax=Cellulomonas edaphi TaxID=3053468 RepID=A0ABT7S9I5_9CELL|nr:pilus assembly protein FlpE [Cellulomons edaphi]MDM7832290.1 pilus assembly protein FlpE [Cellulomons edaphi]
MEVHEWPARATRPSALTVGVVGARGGVGATVLAAALAQRLAQRTATALVGLDRSCAGVDLLLGLEGVPGARWPDLASARGEVDGADVVALLPRWGTCAVLGPDGARPGIPDDDAVRDVLRALGVVLGALVLDLDRAAVLRGAVPACDLVVLVAPRDLAGVAGALAVAGRLNGVPVALVVRGPAPGGMGAAEVGHALAMPVTASWPRDRRLAGTIEHGGLRIAGRTARTVRALERSLP